MEILTFFFTNILLKVRGYKRSEWSKGVFNPIITSSKPTPAPFILLVELEKLSLRWGKNDLFQLIIYDISSFQDCQGAFWLWNGWYSHFTHFQLFNCVQLFNRFLQHNFTDKVKICLNIIKITTAFLWEKFSATHCWSSWASSSSVCQTLSMMSQGLPRLAKREDGTWRKTGNIIFPSGLEIFSAKNGNAWEKNRKYCFSSDLKIFPAKKQNKIFEEVLTKN